MNTLFSAIVADPKTWFGIFGVALVWLYTKVQNTHAEHRRCEVKLAVLEEKFAKECEARAVERGRVDTLTELFKREANLG